MAVGLLVFALGADAIALALGARKAIEYGRISYVPRFARRRSAAVRPGPALLIGRVGDGDGSRDPCVDILGDPVPPGVIVEVSIRTRPFTLTLPSGHTVRVVPEQDISRIEFYHGWVDVDGELHARIVPGDTIVVAGVVAAELRSDLGGRGYRDAATGWVVRPPTGGRLRFLSVYSVTGLGGRARFHARWVFALAAAGGITGWIAIQDRGTLSPVACVALVLLVLFYAASTHGSAPWKEIAIDWTAAPRSDDGEA